MPKLSYLVSTYDSGSFLDRHIADLLELQTDNDLEIIVVNPNSPGTDDLIAKKWVAIDDRVRYFYHEERESYGSSWLRAWQHAEGDFVMNSNTDDFHASNTTEIVHKHMSYATSKMHEGHKVGFCYGGMTVIDERGQVKGRGLKPPFDFELMSRECWAGPQVVWRNDKEFLQEIDFDHLQKRADLLWSGYDYHLWLYFMSLGYHGHVIPEMITTYTQRAGSIENSNKWLNNWDTFVSIGEYFPHHFKSVLKKHKEFLGFPRVPQREVWADVMARGKRWKDEYEWQVI